MSHSKRNTSLAFFTSYERELLRNTWGSQKTRLGRDAFLSFGSCALCLLPATDPVACAGGYPSDTAADDADTAAQTGTKRKRNETRSKLKQCHVFCRECALNNLLTQRKEIKRMEKQVERDREDAADAEALEAEETQRKSVAEFERIQAGLGPVKSTKRPGDYWRSKDATKNDVDAKEILPSFWTPGRLPDQAKKSSDKHDDSATIKKVNPICPCSVPGQSHGLSMKILVPVKFSTDTSARPNSSKNASNESGSRICPACNKPLTNASKAVMARPCGHVLCKSCIDTFILGEAGRDGGEEVIDPNVPKEIQCFVCNENLTDKSDKKDGSKESNRVKPGLVEIACGGTGFAAGGNNMVKREGVSFQHG